MILTETKSKIFSVKGMSELAGWIGIGFIHFNTVPVLYRMFWGIATNIPPLDMVTLIWAGLLLFLIRSIAQVDWLYIVSNGIGFIFNSILLALILLG